MTPWFPELSLENAPLVNRSRESYRAVNMLFI